MKSLLTLAALLLPTTLLHADDPWVVFAGSDGPLKGKHVVLVSGDEEYRSEELIPALGQILAKHHGCKCTVLFPIDNDGTINPKRLDNIPGLEALKTADLMILFIRFRNLPDEQMQHLADYLTAGKPVIGLRTATHAFNLSNSKKFAAWSWGSKVKGFEGGFGKQILGETWVAHHGAHGKESTRGILAKDQKDHPILRGLADGDIWGPTDVYTVRLPLPEGSVPLVYGQVLVGMKFDDPPVMGKKNDPMMPIAWTKPYQLPDGKPGKVFTTTMGAGTDFSNEGFRRLLVNAVYWALDLSEKIPAKAQVDFVTPYNPLPYKFGGHKVGVKPSDWAIR